MALSGLQLAFSLRLVPGRQGRRLGRYLCELEGVLAFEQACQPYVCLIGDGLWARGGAEGFGGMRGFAGC